MWFECRPVFICQSQYQNNFCETFRWYKLIVELLYRCYHWWFCHARLCSWWAKNPWWCKCNSKKIHFPVYLNTLSTATMKSLTGYKCMPCSAMGKRMLMKKIRSKRKLSLKDLTMSTVWNSYLTSPLKAVKLRQLAFNRIALKRKVD